MGTSKSKRTRNPRSKVNRQKKATAKSNQAKADGAVSKTDTIVALLQRPEGATIKAIMKATGWQNHSVRGFLAGTVTKKMSLKLESEKTNGERIYRIARGKKAAVGVPAERQSA